MPMFEVLHHSCNAFAQYHVGACHLKNIIFVITYLLEDEQELSLGMLTRLKRIYTF